MLAGGARRSCPKGKGKRTWYDEQPRERVEEGDLVQVPRARALSPRSAGGGSEHSSRAEHVTKAVHWSEYLPVERAVVHDPPPACAAEADRVVKAPALFFATFSGEAKAVTQSSSFLRRAHS